MKWFKRLSLLLAGLLLGVALIVAAVVLFFDESDHKHLLAWAAGQFLDSELVIDGPLELDIARNLSLASSDIHLEARDGSYTLTVGKLKTSFRLGSYLRTGVFWFNSLELQDVDLEVTENGDKSFEADDFRLPPVVIARAYFNNFALSYREQPPGTLHRFSLDELVIEEAGRGQPVSLHASGLFEGQPFVLEGTADSLAELLETTEPKNVQLSLSGAQGKLLAAGTIADPINGRGLDLQVQADVPQISSLIEILWDEIPVLGSLQGSMTVRGDYSAPRLDDIDLHLARDKEVELTVRGSVADALGGNGMDLQFDGHSGNPEVLSWILFKKLDGMQSVEISGMLKGDIKQPALHDLDASAETADGLELALQGNVDLHPEGVRLKPDHAELAVQLNALNLTASKLPGLQDIPLSGPVTGKAMLALGRDALGIYQADVTIGNRKDARIQLKGDVGHVPFRDVPELSGLRLETDIQSAELARLGDQLDYPLPALGPARLRGTLLSRGTELVLQGTRLNIGTPGQSILEATGMLTTQQDDPAQFRVAMDVDMRTNDLARLGKQFDTTLPALGPARLRGKLVSRDFILRLQDARLDIGKPGQTTVKSIGTVSTPLNDPGRFRATMDVEIQAAELARLAEPFGHTLPELGKTRINGRLESGPSGWQFREAGLVVGAADEPVIRANGSVTTELKKGSTIDVTLDAGVADLVAAVTDRSPGNLGRLRGDAVISNLDGKWGVETFKLDSTGTDLYQLDLDGSYDDVVHYDEASINSRLVVRNPEILGKVLGIKLAGVGPSRMQGKLSVNKGRLRYDGEATVGNTKSTTTISGHLKDGKPVLDGRIKIPVMHLADFGLGPPAPPVPGKPATASPHVFSREPLNTGFLNEVDLDLDVSIDEVESGELAIDSVKGKLQLHDGRLKITPLRLVFEGGNTDINLDVRATAVPEYRLVVKADEVTLGPLMAQFQGQVPIRGHTNIDLDLKARGHSPHELASSLSGNINLGLENARIPKHYVDLLSVDVFGWVVSKSGATQQHMNLNCLVMTFAVKAGEVESETFISDGPRLSLGGEINMNLGTETLDIVLIPQQKKRFFSSVSPVKITGPMKDPKVEAIPVKAALQEVGTMALLPGVVIPARAIGKLWSLLGRDDKAGEGCANIEELREATKRGNAKDKGPVPILDWLWE